MYAYQYPIQRRVLEDRLAFLEKEFQRFDYMINPYHIQPGLLLDVDICSIKRKKATLDGMANVLNEFLHGVSKGFQDAAFASFSRRRSTVREDIAQSFAPPSMEDAAEPAAAGYLAMLNAEPSAPALPESTAEEAPRKKSSGRPKGMVDAAPKKAVGKRGPKPRSKDEGGIREL